MSRFHNLNQAIQLLGFVIQLYYISYKKLTCDSVEIVELITHISGCIKGPFI